MIKKTFYSFTLLFLLNGCVESVALLGSSVGGASSGKIVQSTLQSTISYGIKKQTGKTPVGHALAYAEKNNPEKKKETCISFIEKTRSEFCTIAKKKITSTNKAIKEKIASSTTKKPLTKEQNVTDEEIKSKKEFIQKKNNYFRVVKQSKSPRELAISFQEEMIKLKEKYLKKYLVSG